MLVYHFSDYLELIVGVTLDIGLKGFLHDHLIGEIFHLDLNLEGIPLKDHELILEVV